MPHPHSLIPASGRASQTIQPLFYTIGLAPGAFTIGLAHSRGRVQPLHAPLTTGNKNSAAIIIANPFLLPPTDTRPRTTHTSTSSPTLVIPPPFKPLHRSCHRNPPPGDSVSNRLYTVIMRVRPATPLSIILLIAFALLLLSVLGTPIIPAIYLASHGQVTFGVFGYCGANSSGCSGFVVGYNFGML